MPAAALRARRRWASTPQWVVDVAVGTAITLTAMTTALRHPAPGSAYHDVDGVAVALVLASSLPYYLRRRAPFGAFAVSALAAAVLMLTGHAPGALPLVLLFAIY